MKLRAALLIITLILISIQDTRSQHLDRRPLVLKTSVTSPLGLMRSGIVGIEVPIGKHWATELHIGMTSGALGAWEGTHAPLYAAMAYRYIPVRDWKFPLRVGMEVGYRKMVLWGYHYPCMGWIQDGGNGWFDVKYNCVWRPKDTFDHVQEHLRALVSVGKKLRSETFVWELDLGFGVEHVTTYRIGRREEIPNPGTGEIGNTLEWRANPIVLRPGTEWIPAFKLDLKFGALLRNDD